jgi:hypothetical protein
MITAKIAHVASRQFSLSAPDEQAVRIATKNALRCSETGKRRLRLTLQRRPLLHGHAPVRGRGRVTAHAGRMRKKPSRCRLRELRAGADRCGATRGRTGSHHFSMRLVPLYLCVRTDPIARIWAAPVGHCAQAACSGSIALIQIKYETHESRTKAPRWGYCTNLANMTTYPIDRFWELAVEAGFRPKAVSLQPKQPLINDERYAYFLLEKMKTAP